MQDSAISPTSTVTMSPMSNRLLDLSSTSVTPSNDFDDYIVDGKHVLTERVKGGHGMNTPHLAKRAGQPYNNINGFSDDLSPKMHGSRSRTLPPLSEGLSNRRCSPESASRQWRNGFDPVVMRNRGRDRRTSDQEFRKAFCCNSVTNTNCTDRSKPQHYLTAPRPLGEKRPSILPLAPPLPHFTVLSLVRKHHR